MIEALYWAAVIAGGIVAATIILWILLVILSLLVNKFFMPWLLERQLKKLTRDMKLALKTAGEELQKKGLFDNVPKS